MGLAWGLAIPTSPAPIPLFLHACRRLKLLTVASSASQAAQLQWQQQARRGRFGASPIDVSNGQC